MNTLCEICGNHFEAQTYYGVCPPCQNHHNLREYDRLESLRDRLRRQKLPRALSLQQWMTVISDFKGRCAYCKEYPLRIIDIIDPEKGLVHGNVVPCCGACAVHRRNGFAMAEARVRAYLECKEGQSEQDDILDILVDDDEEILGDEE